MTIMNINTRVRIPTVVIKIDQIPISLPSIIPTNSSTALWTSDRFPINKEPYLLTFALKSTIGHFDKDCFKYELTSGTAHTTFVIFDIETQPTQANDRYNYLTYVVLNGVSENGTPAGSVAQFTYTLSYLDGSKKPHPVQGVRSENEEQTGGPVIENHGDS